MCVFKHLPLMCLVATAFAIRVPLCRPRHGQGLDSADSNENCLCGTGSPTIVDKIDAKHAGVERLVIYVYRQPSTGEIISFIPEREYQRRIPDFPEDYGIIEDISYNPSVLHIFDNSPSKDIRENIDTLKTDLLPQHDQADVVDIKSDDLDDVYGNNQGQPEGDTTPHWQLPVIKPEIEDRDSDEDRRFPKWQRLINNPSDLDPAEVMPHPETGINKYETVFPTANDEHLAYNPEGSPIYVTPGQDPIYVTPGQDPIYVTPGQENEETNNPFENHSESGLPMINNPAHPYVSPKHSVPQKSEESYPGGETSGEGESNREREQSSSQPNPNIGPLNSAEYPLEDNRDGPSNTVSSAERFKVPLRDKYGRIIGWTPHVPSHWEKDRNLPPLINNPNSHNDNRGHRGTPSFDHWLKQQLKLTTLPGNRIPTSTSDIVALHAAIRNLLLQNGFVVTKQGTLTDGYGKVTSLTNLKLRPIFIGQSLSYDRFIQGGGVKFKIHTHTPFLEGLLLTMIKPAKILGIVPLKITSLSSELSPEQKHKTLAIHGHESQAGQKASFKVLPIEDLVSFRKYLRGSKKRRPRPHPTKIAKTKKIEDSALLQQALSKITKPGKKGVREKGLEEIEKGIVSEEKPDFRIIGGASATSSGTPLLFKGRSGLT